MSNYEILRSRKIGRRATQAGVTLIEVLIVVAIMAMIAAGVTVAVIPRFQKAQKDAAEQSARAVRNAALLWKATSNETGCPSVKDLIAAKQLDAAANEKDPWGQDFHIVCTADEEIVVSSDGPDKKAGSSDDITVPKGTSPAGS